MTDQEQSTPKNRPFHSTFLCHLEPDQRAAMETFGDLLESALLEYTRGHGDEPFNLVRARAVLEDLEVLDTYLDEVLDSWAGAHGDTDRDLFDSVREASRLVSDARLTVATGIEDEVHGA